MDDTCTALKAVIDQIWALFDSCCDIHRTYYGGGDMQCDFFWKQQQAFNALLLRHCISKTPSLNTQVKKKADEWTMQIVPMMLFDSDIENGDGRQALLPRLLTFCGNVDSVIQDNIGADQPGSLDFQLSDVINEIWRYFGDCVRKESGKRVTYATCYIKHNDRFIQAMRDNVVTLDQSFHASAVTNANVLKKRDWWVYALIPSFVNAIQNYSDADKQSLLKKLLAFRVELAVAMNMRTGSAVVTDAIQPSYSELHAAVDRLCNLYDRIYPTT